MLELRTPLERFLSLEKLPADLKNTPNEMPFDVDRWVYPVLRQRELCSAAQHIVDDLSASPSLDEHLRLQMGVGDGAGSFMNVGEKIF
jgi:hypothetical protein